MTALIAVSAAIFSIDKPYSYHVPDDMELSVGMRVIVPFGRSNRRSEGIVLELKEENNEGIKSIERVMDSEPILSQNMLKLAAFVRERYFCTFYDAIKAMLPAGLWFEAVERYERTEKETDFSKLSLQEQRILELIDSCGGSISGAELRKLLDDDIDVAVQSLTKKKYLCSNLVFTKRIKDKTERFISLAVPVEDALDFAKKRKHSAPVQCEFLSLLATVGCGSAKELCYLTGATAQTIKRLEHLGYITSLERDVFRSSLPDYVEAAKPVILSAEQARAFENLTKQSKLSKPGVSLLYGVTGSGKTSVYIRLIQQMLDDGKTALYLVPEISLTPQLINLLMSHFGDAVAVLHSALRVSDRYDTWKKIKQGASRVVVGTRSAVFAPLTDLGLIIVDEEQEHSYKSENNPRYHAREVAIFRGMKENALVLLGSATPCIETMYHAKNGMYTLNVLSQRFNGMNLPHVEIIDMKEEIRSGNSSDLSRALVSEIRRNIEASHQSILFLNRRGAARSQICVECGCVQECPRCSVSLTYPSANNRLMCHHCGHSQAVSEFCPNCGGKMKVVGTGTQKIEQTLHSIFPGVETIRMDADTISAANTHENILKRFKDEKIPILIGTQMVTKGLNFENVTLVGIVDADTSLYVNNYRAAEATFSMLTQVIGRAGRGSFSGKAMIQTMTPEHTVIRLAAKQDYDGFYELESTMRFMQNCPPFGDIFTFHFSGLFEEDVVAAAYAFREIACSYLSGGKARILGPAPEAIAKVNNAYRYCLHVSCSNCRKVRLLFAAALKQFSKNKKFKGVTAFADINSYD